MSPRKAVTPVQRASTPLEMEIAAGDDPVAVELDGLIIHVLPVKKWRSSGLRALREGDFSTWAEKCLAEKSITVWEDLDPTIEDVETFFTNWAEATGQSVGKSGASARYSTNTRTK